MNDTIRNSGCFFMEHFYLWSVSFESNQKKTPTQ